MKKGFTLVEVIAIVTILGIILLLITPNILENIDNSKNKSYERQIKTIEQAAERWSVDNAKQLNYDRELLHIGELVDGDYLASNEIIDPRDGSIMKGCIVIDYDHKHNQYTHSYTPLECSDPSFGG